jgi:hypothetical protein
MHGRRMGQRGPGSGWAPLTTMIIDIGPRVDGRTLPDPLAASLEIGVEHGHPVPTQRDISF